MAGDARAAGALDGVLVVDKPRGPTSHDVVWRLRRALGQKRIGHAGTLDPMASGVLVVLLGEATKLAPFLTAHDKRYEARVILGRATATLDAQGEITASAPLPAWLVAEIEREAASDPAGAPRLHQALAAERARTQQIPPAFSAIKVAGERSYDRARRGEDVELEARSVAVQALDVTAAGLLEGGALAYVDLSMCVSKGYYVRSLARDLGEHLGVPSHLAALRRTQSGPFDLARAALLTQDRAALEALVLSLAAAAEIGMPVARLSDEGVTRAMQGKRLHTPHFTVPPPAGEDGPVAWFSPVGRLVAVGIQQHDGYVVQRGFVEGSRGSTGGEDTTSCTTVRFRP